MSGLSYPAPTFSYKKNRILLTDKAILFLYKYRLFQNIVSIKKYRTPYFFYSDTPLLQDGLSRQPLANYDE